MMSKFSAQMDTGDTALILEGALFIANHMKTVSHTVQACQAEHHIHMSEFVHTALQSAEVSCRLGKTTADTGLKAPWVIPVLLLSYQQSWAASWLETFFRVALKAAFVHFFQLQV